MKAARPLLAGAALLVATAASADRIVLAPSGLITRPGSVSFEMATQLQGDRHNFGFINIGPFRPDSGLEVEAEALNLGRHGRETFGFQYTLTGNAFSDIAPAFSVGVRDVLNRGWERQAVWAAATKTIGLSLSQEHLVRDLKVHLGAGTGRIEGPFAGLQARLTLGFSVSAEILARRFNAELSVPLVRNLQLRAYTINGAAYYGAAWRVQR